MTLSWLNNKIFSLFLGSSKKYRYLCQTKNKIIFMNNIDSIHLFDFLKKYGKKDLPELGLEYRHEDGTLMPLADQASVITHYVQLSKHSLCNDKLSKTVQQLIPKWEAFLRSRDLRIVG